jgi:hypothetical protein
MLIQALKEQKESESLLSMQIAIVKDQQKVMLVTLNASSN